MAERKTVLHIIDSLGMGGAETLLVGTIKSTPELNHIIISLKALNEFSNELTGIEIYYLKFKWYHSIPQTVWQVKQIIAKHQVDVIHAHLFWSVIVSRLACPNSIRLLNSYHAILYGTKDGKYPFYARLLDKYTYSSRIITLCVSEEVRNNLEKHIGIKKKVHILHNFIEDVFYNNFRIAPRINSQLKMVAVGNLKKDKNYEVIIEAFRGLNINYTNKISLDIYGKGPLLNDLKNKCIKDNILNIHFKGAVSNIHTILPKYDVYIISSTTEGFGLAVIEAMAVGLPVIVSDIPTLREVTGGNAIYFNSLSSADLIEKIQNVLNGFTDFKAMSINGNEYANKYRKKPYIEELNNFYLN